MGQLHERTVEEHILRSTRDGLESLLCIMAPCKNEGGCPTSQDDIDKFASELRRKPQLGKNAFLSSGCMHGDGQSVR